MRINEPFRTLSGYVAKALPLHKWRRPDGLTSFLSDMIELRKTLCLCHSCEQRMPSRWLDRYNYTLVRGYHAEAIACDRCRNLFPVNMYVATEGRYAQQLLLERRMHDNIRAAKRAAEARDTRYVVSV